MEKFTKAEKDYLLFFYKKACDLFSEYGTDEAYWIQEWYQELGKDVPERFV